MRVSPSGTIGCNVRQLRRGTSHCRPGDSTLSLTLGGLTMGRRWDALTSATIRCEGFATADLLPSALVRLDKLFRAADLRIVICNTVHDSIVIDVHPQEKDVCIKLMRDAMLSLPQETMERYGFRYDMPVGIELKIGKNWLDLHDV